MVHDLTANSDFSGTPRSLNIKLPDRSDEPNPRDELVYTGDALERGQKRFWVDYETDQSLCDCCGGYIDRTPWRFNDNKGKICSACDKAMFAIRSEMSDMTQGFIIGELSSGAFQLSKPWTMDENERENAVDNVLLWD